MIIEEQTRNLSYWNWHAHKKRVVNGGWFKWVDFSKRNVCKWVSVYLMEKAVIIIMTKKTTTAIVVVVHSTLYTINT